MCLQLVDSSADLKDAAYKIKTSKTFDYATSCSSENSIIVVDSIYHKLIAALEKEGGALLSAKEKKILGKKMWNENLIINRDIIAKQASKIATLVGLDNNKYSKTEFLMVEGRWCRRKISILKGKTLTCIDCL